MDNPTNKIIELIADICMDGIVIIDSNSKIIYVNQTWCDLLGYKNKDEVLGKKIIDIHKTSLLPETMKTQEWCNGYLHDIREEEWFDNTKFEPFFYTNRAPIILNGVVVGAIAYIKSLKINSMINKELNKIKNELMFYKEQYQRSENSPVNFEQFYSNNQKMKLIVVKAQKIAKSDLPVLILGETGTGKEVMANCIHFGSKYKDGPFIKVNCASLPESLIESELFGYESGAFSGAQKGGKPGKFELANNGTILLDEIGELPLNMQTKLLHVLQGRIVERIGGVKPIKIDFRLITATNRDLKSMVADNSFRSDLFYRLNVVSVELPPLRERREDIDNLVFQFLTSLNNRNATNIQITEDSISFIKQQPLYGNVRELRNIIERCYVLCESDYITVEDLNFLETKSEKDKQQVDATVLNTLQQTEKSSLEMLLFENDFNISKTAQKLNLNRSTLYRKIKKLNINLNRSS